MNALVMFCALVALYVVTDVAQAGHTCVACSCQNWNPTTSTYGNCHPITSSGCTTGFCVKCESDGTTPMSGSSGKHAAECFKYKARIVSCGKLRDGGCDQWETQKIKTETGSHTEQTCREACSKQTGCGNFFLGKAGGSSPGECLLYKEGAENICTSDGKGNYAQYALKECETIHGMWSEWMSWSICDQPCGTGLRYHNRVCNRPPPSLGGEDCIGADYETEDCNRHSCKISGGVTEWSKWSHCDVTCDGGTETRSRTCTNPPPAYGGADCPEEMTESRSCAQVPCPAPCGLIHVGGCGNRKSFYISEITQVTLPECRQKCLATIGCEEVEYFPSIQLCILLKHGCTKVTSHSDASMYYATCPKGVVPS